MHELRTSFCKHLDHACKHQYYLVWLFPVGLDHHIGAVVTCQQPNYKLIAEANLARVEEVLERDDELAKYLVYQLDLHLGR